MSECWDNLSYKATQVFTPGAPISERDLFAGRLEQVRKVVDTVVSPGRHVLLYGERGVGKTSLANVLETFLQDDTITVLVPRVNCDASDNFTTLWQKLFENIRLTERHPGTGFEATDTTISYPLSDTLQDDLAPSTIRRVLKEISEQSMLIPIFDEFDRLNDNQIALLMADTIKALSDYSIAATIVLIGVAESVDDLIREHQSIERCLVQVPMPRMSNDELTEILDKGLRELNMSILPEPKEKIIGLSQGLPYVTHSLSLTATKAALEGHSMEIKQEHLDSGIKASLTDWQQSIKSSYYDATKSNRRNIYREVVLACALAETDELGYFYAAQVREPLNHIVPDKSYDIPSYAPHLKKLSEEERGNLLERVGEKKRIRYRFKSPLMRPYIVMRGIADDFIDRGTLNLLLGEKTICNDHGPC